MVVRFKAAALGLVFGMLLPYLLAIGLLMRLLPRAVKFLTWFGAAASANYDLDCLIF